MIQPGRVRNLNDLRPNEGGKYVLYWMQASQRTRWNHALEYAISLANSGKRGVVVYFGLMDDYPEANARHYAFMLEGLRDVAGALTKRGIKFVVRRGRPAEVALHYGKGAWQIVCDRGYTRHQRRWRDEVADGAKCTVTEVETDVVVPVEEVSDHAEYAARTIRPKITRLMGEYLVSVREARVGVSTVGMKIKGELDVSEPGEVLRKLRVDRSVERSKYFVGGQVEAGRRLGEFLKKKLAGYAGGRNEPSENWTTVLSPYLQFGQISPVEIALKVRGADAAEEDREALIEELVVRRELAHNFIYYTPGYDEYECLPNWARKSLARHAGDEREVIYTREELERGETHDVYWNAAQREMLRTGYMHNYMRMYWGKKVLEWSATPEEGYGTVLYLNNKYFIDGRGPNAFGNVGWIFGLHDRPWGPERKVFGLVRYMNAAGLERKFDMEKYVSGVTNL